MSKVMLKAGDSLVLLKTLPDNSVDSIVTDPPYGLSFMGKEWDHGVPGSPFWVEALRVAKPGAHLLAFGGTRTFHRLTCAIEDAGWEIRDCIMWVYGSGFPKSLDISKAIDKAAGAKRPVVGTWKPTGTARLKGGSGYGSTSGMGSDADMERRNELPVTAPATDAAKQWNGWGTALKPAWEPVIVARKPLTQSLAKNVQEHGTGALNIDRCRVSGEPIPINKLEGWSGFGELKRPEYTVEISEQGRWPANLIHDGSDEVVALFPETGKSTGGRIGKKESSIVDNAPSGNYEAGDPGYGDTGSAARFFYCAKVSRREREAGCDDLPAKTAGEATGGRQEGSAGLNSPRAGASRHAERVRNDHPTVKPIALMRYLCRMVTPPHGVVLDLFMGSGTTGCAAVLEGFRFVGFDLDEHHVDIAQARIAYWQTHDPDKKDVDSVAGPALPLD